MQAACNSQEFSCTVRIYWSPNLLFIITTVALNWATMKEHFVLKIILENQSQEGGTGGAAVSFGALWTATHSIPRDGAVTPHTPKPSPHVRSSLSKARTGSACVLLGYTKGRKGFLQHQLVRQSRFLNDISTFSSKQSGSALEEE